MAVGKMSKLLLVTLAILCLTAVLVSADDDSWWSKFKSQAKKFGEKAKDGFEDMGEDVKSGLKVAGEKLSGFGKTVSTQAQKGYEAAKDGTKDAFGKVKEVVQGAGSYFGFQTMINYYEMESEDITAPKKYKGIKTKAQKELEDIFDELEP